MMQNNYIILIIVNNFLFLAEVNNICFIDGFNLLERSTEQ